MNRHAKLGRATVEIQGTNLKHGLAGACVETTKGDKIICQRHQVADIARQSLKVFDRLRFRRQSGRFGGLPITVDGKFVLHQLPLRFAQLRTCAKQWRDRCIAQRGDTPRPSRVDTAIEC